MLNLVTEGKLLRNSLQVPLSLAQLPAPDCAWARVLCSMYVRLVPLVWLARPSHLNDGRLGLGRVDGTV